MWSLIGTALLSYRIPPQQAREFAKRPFERQTIPGLKPLVLLDDVVSLRLKARAPISASCR
jgi:hypothetical protein